MNMVVPDGAVIRIDELLLTIAARKHPFAAKHDGARRNKPHCNAQINLGGNGRQS